MEKCFFTLVLVFNLIAFSACNKFTAQKLEIAGWNFTQENQVVLNIGEFGIKIEDSQTFRNETKYSDEIIFSVKNPNDFISALKNNENFSYVERTSKNQEVCVFSDKGNYFYVLPHNDSSRFKNKNLFKLKNAVSFYRADNDILYLFPLFDIEANYDGSFYFNGENRSGITAKDWIYWAKFYSGIGNEYCLTDYESSTVKLKACVIEDSQNMGISDDYKIMLKFKSVDDSMVIEAVLL